MSTFATPVGPTAVGFDGDAIRVLRPGQYLARNLKSGGMAAGRVF